MFDAYAEAELLSEKRAKLFHNSELITRVTSIIHRYELSLIRDESAMKYTLTNENRSDYVRAEIEKRIDTKSLAVAVNMSTFDYYIIVTDGIASASHGLAHYNLDTPSFGGLLDRIVHDLVVNFAVERFIKK